MIKKLITGVATASLFLSSAISVLAVDVEVIGNGLNSDNTVTVTNKCSQSVKQKSDTTVSIGLTMTGNSGNNSANGNTGGAVSIKTGDVKNTAVIGVTGGDNTAEVPDCCCIDQNSQDSITVSGNGQGSNQDVTVKNKSKSRTKQKSKTTLGLSASITGKSGNNKTHNNTGAGAEVKTGSVENTAEVVVTGGENNL